MGVTKKYIQLAKCKIQGTRNLVISKNVINGGYTAAQQIVVEEGNRSTLMFIQGAVHIDNLEGLYNVRDAFNEAIRVEEDRLQNIGENI